MRHHPPTYLHRSLKWASLLDSDGRVPYGASSFRWTALMSEDVVRGETQFEQYRVSVAPPIASKTGRATLSNSIVIHYDCKDVRISLLVGGNGRSCCIPMTQSLVSVAH